VLLLSAVFPALAMNAHTQVTTIAGPVGAIDISIDLPQNEPVRGLALVAHPHPLFAGTKDNKVAQTLARTFVALGYATVRPNFRGVGGTAGEHDKGIGEQDDLLAVIDWMRTQTAWSPEAATLPLAVPTTPSRWRWAASRSAASCRRTWRAAWPKRARPRSGWWW
jgi:X-Pro dipeptidyl-peptidase (S15 family)